jgi:hypothetical protein
MFPILLETTQNLRKFRNSNQNNETQLPFIVNLADVSTSSNEFRATLNAIPDFVTYVL